MHKDLSTPREGVKGEKRKPTDAHARGRTFSSHGVHAKFNLYTRFKNTDTSIEKVYGSSDIWSDDLLKRRKGHVYKTIVVDLKSGRILHVGQGKAAGALAGFWKRVRRKKLDIKYIATDLSAAFISSVLETARTPCMSSTIFMWSNW